MGKCAILIDAGYLNKVVEAEFNRARIDFGKLGDVLAGPMERLRTYYYHCMPYQSDPPTKEERERFAAMDRFIYSLKKQPRFQFRQGSRSSMSVFLTRPRCHAAQPVSSFARTAEVRPVFRGR